MEDRIILLDLPKDSFIIRFWVKHYLKLSLFFILIFLSPEPWYINLILMFTGPSLIGLSTFNFSKYYTYNVSADGNILHIRYLVYNKQNEITIDLLKIHISYREYLAFKTKLAHIFFINNKKRLFCINSEAIGNSKMKIQDVEALYKRLIDYQNSLKENENQE